MGSAGLQSHCRIRQRSNQSIHRRMSQCQEQKQVVHQLQRRLPAQRGLQPRRYTPLGMACHLQHLRTTILLQSRYQCNCCASESPRKVSVCGNGLGVQPTRYILHLVQGDRKIQHLRCFFYRCLNINAAARCCTSTLVIGSVCRRQVCRCT